MTKVLHTKFSVTTTKRVEVIDITEMIRNWVKNEEVTDGILTISSVHTTAGITINEGEHGLMEDIGTHLSKLVPRGAGYQHDRIDNNAHAHIAATLISSSTILSVESEFLGLGTWQRILFVEFDGPRSRTVTCTSVGI